MQLSEITNIANTYTDENFTANIIRQFVNDAIARINMEVKTQLPFIATADGSYTALPETWIRAVIVPYVAYSVKMNDGSLNEADRYLARFNEGVFRLNKEKLTAIPSMFHGPSFRTSVTWVTATEQDYNNCPVDYRIDAGALTIDLREFSVKYYNPARANPATVIRAYDEVQRVPVYVKIGASNAFRMTPYKGWF